jgi:hypothetical protein
MHRRPLSLLSTVLITIGTLALAGCENETPRAMRDRGTAGAPMTATGELATPNPKPMDAQAAFFDGKIGVEAMLAKSDAVWKNPTPAESARSSGRRSGGGGFNAGFGGGGGGGGGRRGGGRRGGDREEADARKEGDDAPRGPTLRASNAPPVQLRLRLTNHGSTPIDVEVLDFNSDLGNFVVEPKKITIPAGESIEADPMTSRLGVPALEQIPLTVRIRVNGKIEQQVLELRPRLEENPPLPGANTSDGPETTKNGATSK